MTSLHRRARRQHVGFAHIILLVLSLCPLYHVSIEYQQRPCLHHRNYPRGGGYHREYISIEPSSPREATQAGH